MFLEIPAKFPRWDRCILGRSVTQLDPVWSENYLSLSLAIKSFQLSGFNTDLRQTGNELRSRSRRQTTCRLCNAHQKPAWTWAGCRMRPFPTSPFHPKKPRSQPIGGRGIPETWEPSGRSSRAATLWLSFWVFSGENQTNANLCLYVNRIPSEQCVASVSLCWLRAAAGRHMSPLSDSARVFSSFYFRFWERVQMLAIPFRQQTPLEKIAAFLRCLLSHHLTASKCRFSLSKSVVYKQRWGKYSQSLLKK